eukprot:IDg12829t1
MDVGKVVITKLNGTNNLVWATQVEDWLQARGLWEYVYTVITTPASSHATHDEIVKAKSVARAAIICSKLADEDDKKYALLNGLRSEYQVKKTILQRNMAQRAGTEFEFEPYDTKMRGTRKVRRGQFDEVVHRRTCHTAVLRKMESINAFHGLNILNSTKNVGNACEACVDDLCGSINPERLGGQRYAQLLTDDYSGAMWYQV